MKGNRTYFEDVQLIISEENEPAFAFTKVGECIVNKAENTA